MIRVLALDYGEKRVGVAISDPLGLTAQSLPYLDNDSNLVKKIKQAIADYVVGEILLGLPKDLHGGIGKKAEEVQAFAGRLEKHIDINIKFIDERNSSKAAEKHMLGLDMSRKKRKEMRDSLSAVFFLQGYLDSK